MLNLFDLSLRAVENAKQVGLTLLPRPIEGVWLDSPPGHYLWIVDEWNAQLVSVDAYRQPYVYDNILPDFHVDEISTLEAPASCRREFRSICYRRNALRRMT